MEVVISRAHEEDLFPAQRHSESVPEPHRGEQPLWITVVFTTIEATLPALEEAHRLAKDLFARMRILMPQVVPYALPLDRPAVDPAFRVQRLCGSAFDASVPMRIEVHLCRDLEMAVSAALRPGSLVVLGCRKRWWAARESSLARKLRRAGHQVLVI